VRACVRARARACGRARVRAGARACVRVCVFSQLCKCVSFSSTAFLTRHFAPGRAAKYCDDHVSVFVFKHISGATRPIFTKFFCMLPMAVVCSSSAGIVICYVLPVSWMT